MNTNLLVLLYVLSLSLRTAPALAQEPYRRISAGLGSLLLLLLPVAMLHVSPIWGGEWQPEIHFVGFSLSVILLVVREPDWEQWWSLGLVWTVLPLVASSVTPGFWLAIAMAEFLLFLAHHLHDPSSPYHKYALVRLLVVFQFFVFESLFPLLRPPGAARALSGLLLLLYCIALQDVLARAVRRRKPFWPFFIAYIQYGWLLAGRLWPIIMRD